MKWFLVPSRLRFDSSLGQERIDRRVALIQGNERKRLEHVLEFLDGEPSAAPLLGLLVASDLIKHRDRDRRGRGVGGAGALR